MTYTKQNWVDDVTEVDKLHMDHIEDGIVALDTGHAAAMGQPFGYASLGGDGIVPASQLPTPSGGGGTTVSLPTGALLDWPTATPPSGFLLCDGGAGSRFTYSDLFGVLGTAYGAGDGTSTFNLPDFQGRVAVMKGTAAAVNALGKNDGQGVNGRSIQHSHTNGVTASHNLVLPDHAHAVNESGHTHDSDMWGNTIGGSAHAITGLTQTGSDPYNGVATGIVRAATTGVSVGNPTTHPAISGGVTVGGSIGVGVPGDAPAYLVINKVIKT